MAEMTNLQTTPFVPLLDVLLGDNLNLTSNAHELKKSLIAVMPYYPLEHTHIAFSSKTSAMNFEDIINLSKKLMSLIIKMHQLGYAHRDLKHNNVLVNTNWRYVLIDFGMVQFDPDLH